MGKFSERAKRAGAWAVDEWKRQEERDRERREKETAEAERAARKRADRDRRKAAKAHKAADALRRTCRYVGGTSELPLVPAREDTNARIPVAPKEYEFRLDSEGLHVAARGLTRFGEPPLVSLPWSNVSAIEVADASRTEITSRVSHHQAGGLTDLFHTAPVAKTRSRFLGWSYVTVQTGSDRFVFSVAETGQKIEAHLLLSEPKRVGQVSAQHSSSSESDSFDQLRKLGELRDAGVLTDDEFTDKKHEILKRL